MNIYMRNILGSFLCGITFATFFMLLVYIWFIEPVLSEMEDEAIIRSVQIDNLLMNRPGASCPNYELIEFEYDRDNG